MKIETVSMDEVPKRRTNRRGFWIDLIENLTNGEIKKITREPRDAPLIRMQNSALSSARYHKKQICTRAVGNDLYVWLKPESHGRDERNEK